MNTQTTYSAPHNIEAERSVLGAILINSKALSLVQEQGLQARDFYVDAHQKIFEIILFLSERNHPLDLVTLSDQLRDRGWYEAIGGTAILTSLFEDAFRVSNAAFYAEIIKNKSILRRVIEAASEMTVEAMAGVQDTSEFLDEIEQKVFAISDIKITNSSSSLKDIFLKNIQTIEDLSLKKSDVIGLPTGFRSFDRLTGGLRAGQLMILAARPAMGKTSLFLSMSQNVVTQDPNAVVAVFSLEMSKDELGFRLLSSTTRIPASRLKTGNLTGSDWPLLLSNSTKLSSAKLHIDDAPGLTVMDIKARCRRISAKEKRIDLVVIDYLQLMKGTKASQRGEGTREREVSEISRGLKALAKELNVPVIALSQLNRALEGRPNKRPMLSDLRESGSIEADADIVAFIHREEIYNPATEDKGIAELIIAKHRAGPTDTVKLRWLPEFTLFTDLDCAQVRKLPISLEVAR